MNAGRLRTCALAGSLAVLAALSAGPPSAEDLAEQVTIRRDTYGVPHILAKTEEAAALAMGYAQAEDHCLELARRLVSARGEEARRTGAGAESDFDGQRFDVYAGAQKQFPALPPLMQRMLSAY